MCLSGKNVATLFPTDELQVLNIVQTERRHITVPQGFDAQKA